MTDTQAPERIWIKEAYDSWGTYGHWYEDATGGGHEFVNTDLHAAVVAERDQLKRLLKDAIEWNWIDFQDEEHKETYPRLSKLEADIQAALEAPHD